MAELKLGLGMALFRCLFEPFQTLSGCSIRAEPTCMRYGRVMDSKPKMRFQMPLVSRLSVTTDHLVPVLGNAESALKAYP